MGEGGYNLIIRQENMMGVVWGGGQEGRMVVGTSCLLPHLPAPPPP